jgi:hypothetical protein
VVDVVAIDAVSKQIKVQYLTMDHPLSMKPKRPPLPPKSDKGRGFHVNNNDNCCQ